MESKGIVHETGYNVEIAIPFKSLRFEAGKGKLWGAHFFRRIKRLERNSIRGCLSPQHRQQPEPGRTSDRSRRIFVERTIE
jgi:hypothetical protein